MFSLLYNPFILPESLNGFGRKSSIYREGLEILLKQFAPQQQPVGIRNIKRMKADKVAYQTQRHVLPAAGEEALSCPAIALSRPDMCNHVICNRTHGLCAVKILAAQADTARCTSSLFQGIFSAEERRLKEWAVYSARPVRKHRTLSAAPEQAAAGSTAAVQSTPLRKTFPLLSRAW